MSHYIFHGRLIHLCTMQRCLSAILQISKKISNYVLWKIHNEALHKGAIKAIMKMTDFISRFILCNTSTRYKFFVHEEPTLHIVRTLPSTSHAQAMVTRIGWAISWWTTPVNKEESIFVVKSQRFQENSSRARRPNKGRFRARRGSPQDEDLTDCQTGRRTDMRATMLYFVK